MENISVRFVDVNVLNGLIASGGRNNLLARDSIRKIDISYPSFGNVGGFLPMSNTEDIHFNIFYNTKSLSVVQQYLIKRIDQKYKSATRINIDGKILFEEIDEDFPRNNLNEIDWK